MLTQKVFVTFSAAKKGWHNITTLDVKDGIKNCYYMPWPQACIESQKEKHTRRPDKKEQREK